MRAALAGTGHGPHELFIEVFAKAHGGGCHPHARQGPYLRDDVFDPTQAMIGLTIGEQHHPSHALAAHIAGKQFRAAQPTPMQCGAATGRDARKRGVDDQGRLLGRCEWESGLDVLVVVDKCNRILLAQALNELGHAALGLIELAVGHGAGAVEHQGQVQGNGLAALAVGGVCHHANQQIEMLGGVAVETIAAGRDMDFHLLAPWLGVGVMPR